MTEENDDLLEKQIEEKEKILAKMLNLESLSLTRPAKESHERSHEDIITEYNKKNITEKSVIDTMEPVTERPPTRFKTENKIPKKESNPVDLIPKIVKLPNTWNLEKIELKLEPQSMRNGHDLVSPDDNLDGEWEFI